MRHLSAIVPVVLAHLVAATAATTPATRPAGDVSTLDEVLASGRDLWGEAAIARPEGPTFDFFAGRLPPLRYVDAPFRCYPIVLSAPGAAVKARLVSDGSAVNALARMPKWRTEAGTPVTFHVGADQQVFGHDLARLSGPRYADGYLPVVQSTYAHGKAEYSQEVFASVDPALSQHGVVFCRFTVPKGQRAKIEAWIENTNPTSEESIARDADGDVISASVTGANGVVRRGDKVIACYDERWEYTPARATLTAYLSPGESAVLAIYTTPPPEGHKLPPPLTAATYDEQRQRCVEAWSRVVSSGTTVRVPESYVNDAWRSGLVGMYTLLNGNLMRYSAGNQYAGLYIGEGGDAVRTLALYGHADTARAVMPPLFRFTRKGLEYHQAGFKLQMLAHYYRLTRDKSAVEEFRPFWEKEIGVVLDGLKKGGGLVPPERYAGDLAGQVPSLNSNANCWRALREWESIMRELGNGGRADELAGTAAGLRKATLAKVDQALDRSTAPPFMPVNLSGTEKPYSPITETSPGSYWNIMVTYVLGSGVFPYNSKYADDLLTYQRTQGGQCMGLNRSSLHRTQWPAEGAAGINDLYGMRSALVNLQRDDVDRALVTFYGKLAHGLTRDTFIGGEGSCIVPTDRFGRQMTLPPNSTSNAFFLWHLRHMLVQDFDLDDDGRAESLRLCFATPRHWLADGQTIEVKAAPTVFGPVSLHVASRLAAQQVDTTLSLPSPGAPKAFLRLRLPDGHRIARAATNGREVPVTGDTLDLSGFTGDVRIHVATE